MYKFFEGFIFCFICITSIFINFYKYTITFITIVLTFNFFLYKRNKKIVSKVNKTIIIIFLLFLILVIIISIFGGIQNFIKGIDY